MADLNRREQVKELIEGGNMTKAQIAEQLGVSAASVSSQMTYLRWMGNFIKYDENKILSLVSEEAYNAWQAELAANRTTKTASNKTPEEQALAVSKAIDRQTVSLANWNKKLEKVETDLIDEPDDDELLELQSEATANITLFEIKIKRNQRKAATLPDVVETADAAVDADDDQDVMEDEEDLI